MLSRRAKTFCMLWEGFQLLENVLRAAGKFPAPGKRPAHCGKVSSPWKTSCMLLEGFQPLENVLHAAGRFPALGKTQAASSAFIRRSASSSISFLQQSEMRMYRSPLLPKMKPGVRKTFAP